MKRLSKKLKFVKSDDLMESLLLKEQEKEKEENGENKDLEESQQNNEDLGNSKQLRNLAFEGSFSKSWTLATLNILGKEILLKYEINLGEGKLKNILSISCESNIHLLGNLGTASNKNQPNTNTGDKTLFVVPFPGVPVPIHFTFKAGGSIAYSVEYDSSQKKFTISLTGSLNAKGELPTGVAHALNTAVGAKGTIINIKAKNTLTKTASSFVDQNIIIISGTKISCHASGALLTFEKFEKTLNYLNDWSKTLT